MKYKKITEIVKEYLGIDIVPEDVTLVTELPKLVKAGFVSKDEYYRFTIDRIKIHNKIVVEFGEENIRNITVYWYQIYVTV
jgi:hypothetical protein